MPLNIRDEKAVTLAKDLAKVDGTTMTNAVITALKESLAARRNARPLRDRHRVIADRLAAESGGSGRQVFEDEIEDLWRS